MERKTVEDVLQQGIYGPLETKPEERRKYLGTLRERIIVALTKSQVAETKIYPQVEQFMKEYPKAHLLLNGNMAYEELSKYVKLASKNKMEHKIVTNKEHDTDIGLVLAMSVAIDKEDIFISQKVQIPEKLPEKKSLFAKLFKR
ncbi:MULTISPECIES: YueI family protein [unclassified Bacillus (in: firmicutes)]|uniref:YueI family protein n=1 Tax=unclassified Bacillus (in: firmicutes) TaxID=185979 RepID=UPI0020D27858|nr:MULTISPECIES: YueI family protein [unclassified Bacillus (in: firmicutes)]